MAITAKKTGGNRVYINAPADTYQGVCVDVIDLGIVTPKNPQHKPAHKVKFLFQLDGLITEKMIKAAKKAQGDKSPLSEAETKLIGQRLIIGQQFTLSLHEKALLRKTLASWRGEDFTTDELNQGFDVEQCIGWNGQINVIHNTADDGKVYANVAALLPWKTKFGELMEPENYVRMVDRPKDGKAASAVNDDDEDEEDDEKVPFD